MIIGLFPELNATGGIPRVGRQIAAVLTEYAESQGMPCVLLGLNEPRGTTSVEEAGRELRIRGFGGSKVHMAAATVRLALKRPRLVVANHPNLAPVVYGAKRVSPRTRTLVFGHGVDAWEPLALHRRWSLRAVDRVLGPSAHTVRKLVSVQGLAPERVRRLPWGLDPSFQSGSDREPDGPAPALPTGRLILTVGRLAADEQYKGVDNLIRALPRLKERVPDVHLVVVGQGDDRGRLERMARDAGVADRVLFTGRVPQDALLHYYRACDVFALPSRGEGFGLVFLEAMAAGKPVVGGDHGGTPDIIRDGETGFLVRHSDLEGLTGVLESLLSDAELRAEIGRRGLERLRSEFLHGHFRAALLDEVRELDGGPPAVRAEPRAAPAPGHRFSLIMATRGRVAEPRRLLDSLESQSFRDFELIVIDQNDDDRVARILEERERNYPIRHIRTAPGNSYGRNVGMENSRGEILAFPDDDCIYPDDVLERADRAFRRFPNAGAMVGVMLDWDGRPAFPYPAEPGYLRDVEATRRVNTITLFVRGTVPRVVGGFDVQLGYGGEALVGGEDIDYPIRIIRNGFPVRYDPSIQVIHHPPELHKAHGYGRATMYIWRKHRLPRRLIAYYVFRSLAGSAVSLAGGDLEKATFRWQTFRGVLDEWWSGPHPGGNGAR